MAAKGAWVEDAITGRVLKIEQLLSIKMATGEDAVALEPAELAKTAPADLVWTRGCNDLRPGDRVRHGARYGTVGFKNDEGATVALSKGEPRRFCGRTLGSRTCGLEPGGAAGVGGGGGPPCASCRRFAAEHQAALFAAGASPSCTTWSSSRRTRARPERRLLLAHALERAARSRACTARPAPPSARATASSSRAAANASRSGKRVPLEYAPHRWR